MPLSEAPITSYFPRLGKSKQNQQIRNAKRKHKKAIASVAESVSAVANVLAKADPRTEPGPSMKRSRKNTSCSLSSASSASLPPADDIFHAKTRKAKRIRSDGINKTHSVISLNDDSDDDIHTKNDAGLSCSASDDRCLGSLSLNSVKGKGTLQQLHQEENPTLRPFVTRDIVLPTSLKSRLKLLADGTTKRCPRSGTLPSSSRRDSMPVQDRSNGEHEVVILSSQAFERQEERLYVPYSTEESGATGVDTDYNDAFTDIPENKVLPSNHRQYVDTDLEIIKSSQTQDMLLDYVSPRRHHTSKRFCTPDPLHSLETTVRSSQSQFEVDMSQSSSYFGLNRISERTCPPDADKSSSYREEQSKSQFPICTYSDGLFSIPRRDSSFTGLFAQEPMMNDHCPNKTTTAKSNGPPVQEDSETEPDTDDEMLDPCMMKDNPRQASASSNEASNEFCVSHSSDDNYPSLPEVVEEFRAMFGSDESYPPDFPSSLRQ